MGIQGLLPLLKSIMLPIHIKDLQGSCVAIDTYSWLHKGALSCSKDLCKGLPTSKHIDYCMHRVNLLRHHGIKPVLVFDGGFLPMKSDQENKRGRSRKENLSRAIEHESNGNMSAAYECYQKAVDVSPSMAYQLIQVLKQENISYVVAPYEADAQMTFLAISKQVDAVITEDSDLIAFGCPRIIYKMDKFGQGVEFRYSKLQQNKDLNFTGFTEQMVLEMCILSGCDYLQSLPGMGLKKAHALIKKFRTYDKVIKHLKYNTVAVPPLYEDSFKQAIMTFRHQRVYDPITEDIVHLSELSESPGEDLDFLGPSIPQDVATGIARGELDPFTKIPFQQGDHSGAELVIVETNQLKKFKPESERKKLELPAQKNLLTNYFCSASLEAKRNFKAPRITPPEESSIEEASSPVVDLTMESKSWRLNSLIDSEDVFVVDAPGDSMRAPEAVWKSEVGADGRGIRQGLLQNTIHKPCVILHKEHASHPADKSMTTEKGNVTVRSSYFPSSYVREIDQGNKDTVIVRSSYFQKKSTNDSDCSSKNEKQLVKDGDALKYIETRRKGGKLKLSNRKVSLRSSYFEKNSVVGNTEEGEELRCDAIDSCEDSDPIEGVGKRQKIAPGNFNETANETNDGNDNPSPADTSLHIESNHISDLDETTTEMKAEEGKFGCNISHLSHYSEVAEKSMEKFVSVISSFKFTSTGSRASGLRPPLKDIRNTAPRLSGNMELNKFAYVPTKQKASAVHRKF